MGILNRIKTALSNKPVDEQINRKEDNIISYNDKGEQVIIPRAQWRDSVLPETIKKTWNDPETLYGTIVMAMQDGFFIEIIDAAKQLVLIDKDIDRSYNVLGIAYLHTNSLAEAELILEEGIKKSEYKAVLTTNLAKVYAAQGLEEKSVQTLWKAIQLDPNQDNGLDWYTAIEYEKGGEKGRLQAYKKIAELPNSWRAKLYIARYHLEEKQFDIAKQIYREILTIARNEPDAIWIITGDLGLNNRIDDIFELVFPIFDVNKHGVNATLNLIQACIQTKRKSDGLKLLDDFKKLQRYDLLQIANDFETKLRKLK
jgi:tetratricopeptide (TPR) repeat protein